MRIGDGSWSLNLPTSDRILLRLSTSSSRLAENSNHPGNKYITNTVRFRRSIFDS